jgi:hypothetical protein
MGGWCNALPTPNRSLTLSIEQEDVAMAEDGNNYEPRHNPTAAIAAWLNALFR